LVVGTHGRSFWILDDVTPLRQLNERVSPSAPYLFAPQDAVRIHWNRNPDTPLPPEEPGGKNPPDGAIIDYFLPSGSSSPVTLEILDAAGKLVRRYSSTDKAKPISEIAPKHPIPMYWVREDKILSAEAGMHRFVWDVRYAAPKSLSHGYPISAILHDTPLEPLGPWALPGRYTVKLTVSGKTWTQSVVLKMDPRVKSTPAELAQQFAMQRASAAGMDESFEVLETLHSVRGQIADRISKANGELKIKLIDFDKQLAAIEGAAVPGFFGTPLAGKQPENFSTLNQRFGRILSIADSADVAPTPTSEALARELEGALKQSCDRWNDVKTSQVNVLNQLLGRAKLQKIDPNNRDGEAPSSEADGDDDP